MTDSPWTEGLNEAQQTALLEVERPVLILAGAGSGKTRVITHKIAHLMSDYGIAPWSILAVTFTNKAAREMRERALALMSGQSSRVLSARDFWISTFHSICARILRTEAEHLGYDRSFSIFDSADSRTLVKQVIEDAKHAIGGTKAATIAGLISNLKNSMVTPDEAEAQGRQDKDAFFTEVARIYRTYQLRLKEVNAFDFDDLLLKTLELLVSHPNVREKYQKRFQYFLVDEFQDTNLPQYQIIRTLVGQSSKLSVVGDDDQSIYSWRGATIDNIVNFNQDYPDSVLVKLEQNYRSSMCILKAAHCVVKHNQGRLEKQLWSELGDGEPIDVFLLSDDEQEARLVASKIQEIRGDDPDASVAVFYRTNAQSRALEVDLRRQGIPYQIFGSVRYYDRKEVKDLLAYLTVLVNPFNDVALLRALGVPTRGVGSKTLERIWTQAAEVGRPSLEIIPDLIDAGTIKGRAAKGLVEFLVLYKDLEEAMATQTPSQVLRMLITRLKYREYIENLDEDEGRAEDRQQNIDELIHALEAYEQEASEPSLVEYLETVSLFAQTDSESEEQNPVSLMSVHTSKGLEFDWVFVTGMDDGLFPHGNAFDNPDQMEEERRLAYVAFTRARRRLILTSARMRGAFPRPPSRFLEDIDPSLFRMHEQRGNDEDFASDFHRRQQTARRRLSRVNQSPAKQHSLRPEQVPVGTLVEHPRFGKGEVVEVIRNQQLVFIMVRFFGDGTRRLLPLRSTPLTVHEGVAE